MQSEILTYNLPLYIATHCFEYILSSKKTFSLKTSMFNQFLLSVLF